MSESVEAPPTMEQVEEKRARAREIEDRVRWLNARLAEITDGLVSLHAEARGDSDEARKLREERRGLQDEREEFAAALPLLEAQVEREREGALRAQAEARLGEIQRSVGGTTGHQRRAIGQLQKKGEAFLRELRGINERYKDQQPLLAEARALARRFGLPLPEMKTLRAPALDEHVVETTREVREGAFPVRPRGLTLEEFPADSPGRRILDAIGPTEAERKAQENARKRDEERRREEEAALEPFAGELERAEALEWARGGFRS